MSGERCGIRERPSGRSFHHDRSNRFLPLRPGLHLSPTVPVRPGVPVLRGKPVRLEKEVAIPGCAAQTPAQPANPLADLLVRRREFLGFLQRRVSSAALAEDILQSAYLRALERSGELRATESSAAWFYRILRNAVIDFYRHRSVQDRALAEWAKELEVEVPADDLTRDIVCRCIERVLPMLKPSYAEALRAVDLDETPLGAYAAAHAITLPNATVRIHRARKALKQALIATCGSCSTHGCLNCTCVS